MRYSQFFAPLSKEIPAEASIVSHQLMLRSGMIRQASAGIYVWLPLGLRVLKKVEEIVREEQNHAGALEVLMPTIQSADLWQESGRYDDYGEEMLRITDRAGRELLYGPTNEEQITEAFRAYCRSYKDCPKIFYHIQWKFRDEIRPRFGVMRGREFLMKDAYSFDLDEAGARHAYNKMFVAYLRSFTRMGLQAIPMRADTGPIGGDMSHEFLIMAKTGESAVFCDHALLGKNAPIGDIDYENSEVVAQMVNDWTSHYAATEELHSPEEFEREVAPAERVNARGIEVGHIFYFADKYSKAMQAVVQSDAGQTPVMMGSYGIGISRLVGALIEAHHDEKGIVWPKAVAPFHISLTNMRVGDTQSDAACEQAYAALTESGMDILYDDRDERAGAKFAAHELIGSPKQLIIGPRGLKENQVELKDRATNDVEKLPLDAAIAKLETWFDHDG